MKNLKDLILEKLKRSHEYASNNDVTYEKFIDVFQDLGNHTIYFENHLGLIGDDYPTFNGYPGMDAALNKCVGKKFKSMTLERNSKNQLELHLNFKRSIGNITNIVITNTDELYNYLGDDQVSILYDLIKDFVDVQWIQKKILKESPTKSRAFNFIFFSIFEYFF